MESSPSSTRYVQHISKQGEKYKISCEYNTYWAVEKRQHYYYLPKEAYIPCDPPEQWVDVTKDCFLDNENIRHNCINVYTARWYQEGDYRLTKVNKDNLTGPHSYFIVEKRVS